jgi:flagellar motor switch protein FliN/FliY
MDGCLKDFPMTTESSSQELIPSSFDMPVDDFDESIFPAAGGEPVSAAVAPAGDPMEAVFDVPVKVKAVLGGARIHVGELIQMRSGSVVELDRRVGEPVDVFVNDLLIARGELVIIDGSLGVTLTEIVKQEG